MDRELSDEIDGMVEHYKLALPRNTMRLVALCNASLYAGGEFYQGGDLTTFPDDDAPYRRFDFGACVDSLRVRLDMIEDITTEVCVERAPYEPDDQDDEDEDDPEEDAEWITERHDGTAQIIIERLVGKELARYL